MTCCTTGSQACNRLAASQQPLFHQHTNTSCCYLSLLAWAQLTVNVKAFVSPASIAVLPWPVSSRQSTTPRRASSYHKWCNEKQVYINKTTIAILPEAAMTAWFSTRSLNSRCILPMNPNCKHLQSKQASANHEPLYCRCHHRGFSFAQE